MTGEERYKGEQYRWDNPTWHTEDSPWKAGKISSILGDNGVSFGTCVEIGCGAGQVVDVLSTQYLEADFSGWDISPEAASFWSPDSRVDFTCGDVTTASERYDLALSIDVMEHVEDYMGFLRSCRALAEWHVFHIPLDMNVSGVLRDRQLHWRETVGHLHYFSRGTAIATLVDCGYTIVDERYTAAAIERHSARSGALLNPVRRAVSKVSISAAAKLLGGYSLLVLARSDLG